MKTNKLALGTLFLDVCFLPVLRRLIASCGKFDCKDEPRDHTHTHAPLLKKIRRTTRTMLNEFLWSTSSNAVLSRSRGPQ